MCIIRRSNLIRIFRCAVIRTLLNSYLKILIVASAVIWILLKSYLPGRIAGTVTGTLLYSFLGGFSKSLVPSSGSCCIHTWKDSHGHWCRHRDLEPLFILSVDIVEETVERLLTQIANQDFAFKKYVCNNA